MFVGDQQDLADVMRWLRCNYPSLEQADYPTMFRCKRSMELEVDLVELESSLFRKLIGI